MALPGEGADLTVEAVKDELTAITKEVAQKKGIDPIEVDYAAVDTRKRAGDGADGCIYFNQDDGSPSCIVGHWLHHRYRLSLQELVDADFHHGDMNSAAFGDLVMPLLPSLPEEVEHFLLNVQTYQDEGGAWLNAIAHGWDSHREEYEDEEYEDEADL